MTKRKNSRRRHRKNSSETPSWVVPVVVVGGLGVAFWLYKKSQPETAAAPEAAASAPQAAAFTAPVTSTHVYHSRQSAKP